MLPRGTVTDDTFGALAIVDAIVERGEISLETFVESNINWVTYADALSYELGRNRGLAGPRPARRLPSCARVFRPLKRAQAG